MAFSIPFTYTVGTGANNLVQLNGSSQLPAVSAVNLTNINASNIASGTIAAARLPTGIDAANIGGGAVSNTEFSYLDGVTSAIQTQLDGKASTSSAPAIVCVSPTSNTTWNGNSGTYTSATDLAVTPSATGKWSVELLILTKLTTTAVSTAFRVLLGGGAAIANADADPVGAALAQGASGFANMTYTSSTGVISGNSKSSGDNYVIFWARYEVDVTTAGTFTPQLSIAGSTSSVLSLKAGSYHKWTKL